MVAAKLIHQMIRCMQEPPSENNALERRLPVFFHQDQLLHKPEFEWSFGKRIDHPETTRRAESIQAAINRHSNLYELHIPDLIPIGAILATHDRKLLQVYQTATCLQPDQTYYPSVFPPRRRVKADPTKMNQAGFYCFDSGTPLNHTTLMAATWSAACAYELAHHILAGHTLSGYALCRPPGHHASRSLFGGYCYFNNAAIAAKVLRTHGKVCIVDIDFHHGNGTQRIFYEDDRVLFVSVHGDPSIYYPYYEGFEDEQGAGKGFGFNHNFCLGPGTDYKIYEDLLKDRVMPVLEAFDPDFLVLSAGFDTFEGDPVGGFVLQTEDFHPLGKFFGDLRLPTAIIQEGGYRAEELGDNVDSFLQGFMEGFPGCI